MVFFRDLNLEDKNIDGSFLQAHLEYTELALLDVRNETEEEAFYKAFPQESMPEDGKMPSNVLNLNPSNYTDVK